MISKVTYNGNLRTTCEHNASGSIFVTDAPVDNNGLGQAFSPTDTVATALASCMLTVMGIKARGLGINLKGATAAVTKQMGTGPRRIVALVIELELPKAVSEKHRMILEKTANTCPVHFSIHPEIKKTITYSWSQDAS